MNLPRRSVQSSVVVVLAIAAFIGSIGGELVSDDGSLIGVASNDLASAVLGRFWHVAGSADERGIYANAYRPFAQLMFALQKRAFGAEPAPFHVINLLLHACNSILVWRWLSRRLRPKNGNPSPGHELAALLGAALFAVHPAHAESVAWISGATDLYMTLLLLVGCELLERGQLARGLAPLAFACAVFSKEPAAVAPALCALDAFARGLPRRRVIGDTVLAGIGVGVGTAVVYFVGFAGPGGVPLHVDALRALALTGHYVRIALAPAHLEFEALPYAVDAHGLHTMPASVATGAVAWGLLLLLAILALRHERARPWCADAAWFCLLLLPVVLLLQTMVSDRFLYAPLLGVCALGSRALLHALRASRAVAYTGVAVACALIAIAIPKSAAASRAFLDDETLWRSQVEVFPDNPKALDALAEALSTRGRFDEARVYFERGLQKAHAAGQRAVALHFAGHLIALPAIAKPEWDTAALAETHAGCQALLQRHRVEYTRGALHFASDVAPRELYPLLASPTFLLVPCARAALSAQTLSEAVRLGQRAVAIAPGDAAAAEIHALALARSGAYVQAGAEAKRAFGLRNAPQLAELVNRIAAAEQLARADTATSDARGRALVGFRIAMTLGSPHAARAAILPALRGAPGDPELVHALVQTYVVERRFVEARAAIDDAARAAPADASIAQMAQSLSEAEAAVRAAPAQGASAKQ